MKAMKVFAKFLARRDEDSRAFGEALATRSELIDQANALPPPTDTEIPGLIRQLASTNELVQKIAFWRLQKASPRTEAALRAALRDPAITWTAPAADCDPPAAKVVTLLGQIPSRWLADAIAHLADDEDWRKYGPAVEARAARGLAGDLPAVIRDLESGEGVRVRSAEEGVERGIEKEWAEAAFVEGLLAWARRCALDPGACRSQWAVKFFADRGGAAAIDALQSPSVLSLDNERNIHSVLGALDSAGVRLRPELLREFIAKSLASDEQWPWQWVFERALKLLWRVHPDEAMRVAGENVENSHARFAEDSIEFLRRAHGLPRPWEAAAREGEGLAEGDRQILETLNDTTEALGEIGNGGLSQYFFNSTGDRWEVHVKALRAIGLERGAEAILEGLRVLGLQGRAREREERIRAYAALGEEGERKLDALTRELWGVNGERAQFRYMLRHRELFRRLNREGYEGEKAP
jgi:hypothetical protein